MAMYKDMNELFQYWENNRTYPDYVCGVWSTHGGMEHLTVAVNSVDAEREILSLIENDSSVAFAYQIYSKNYLLSIIDEMNERFSDTEYSEKTGFVWMGLNEYDNRVEFGFKKGYENDLTSLELINELTERFGDAVQIEYTDEVICYATEDIMSYPLPLEDVGSTIIYTPSNNSKISSFEGDLITCCMILAISVLILSAAFILQRKRLLRLSDGSVKASYEKSEIECAVKSSSLTPPPDLDKRIMDMIDD